MTIKNLFTAFNHRESYKSHQRITSGHINATYKVTAVSGNAYILQELNSSIFKNIEKLLKNKVAISKHLKIKDTLEVAEYFMATDGLYYFLGPQNTYWTLCVFIKDSTTFLITKDEEMARQAGIAIGRFHKSTADFNADTLYEILPNFHDVSFRLKQFESALKNCSDELRLETMELIEIVQNNKYEALELLSIKNSGEIPIRVTHNDAKLSNLIFHKKTLEAIALIDFDTVMPGIIHFDIGDAVRSIGSTALEDEPDLVKVDFNLDYYRAFIVGFVSEMGNKLSKTEINYLPFSANYIVYIQGVRFLGDYLNGNTYYKINYPKHNLVRAKNQFKLLQVLNKNLKEIKAITYNAFNF
jgi:Ser/Thr protein kinase RdoA (MazF antagonist)